MAPRNRGKGKKGGKQKKKKNVAENEVEEKYRKAALEVDILKEHLALRRDVARQAKDDSEGLKQRLLELEQELEMSRDDKKDIYEEMIRQYQELQRQTETRIQQLETETKQLQEQLAVTSRLLCWALLPAIPCSYSAFQLHCLPPLTAWCLSLAATCREDIQQARAEREQVLGEKDQTIAELQGKINAMETEYEKILHGSLDRVLSKLAAAQGCWEKEATAMHMEHKERLREFGLNPLEI
ncbi:coiled-coil domain-containing protein 153 isoform X2 [Mauremys mutica]|nr:coiled-coil domain-containing protein 153 isoform X2 [Mauremys mutica]XP_044852948.1 coiled-coil domain-containing protein 153 isoform X2 [Mauremys mutica]XP_044852949.1 coiled-coil domain-containing protein 153 isoform X2 [Mauremys mutica]